jgi:hypothetical protein
VAAPGAGVTDPAIDRVALRLVAEAIENPIEP